MTLKVKIANAKKLRKELRKAKTRIERAAKTAVYVAGNVIMTDAKKRAPVFDGDPAKYKGRPGTLRNSGYVSIPQANVNIIEVEIGFGGDAQAYAARQHEETEWRHSVGEAKYLERALISKAREAFDTGSKLASRSFDTNKQIRSQIHTSDPFKPKA